MDENKKSFFAGVKTEFGKIAWPEIPDVVKQTVAVVSATVVVGIIIAVLDYVMQFGIDKLINLNF